MYPRLTFESQKDARTGEIGGECPASVFPLEEPVFIIWVTGILGDSAPVSIGPEVVSYLIPIDTGGACRQCGSLLVGTNSDEQFAIGCPACGRTHGQYSFPPDGLVTRDNAETLSAFNRRVWHLHGLAMDAVCPECTGQMRTEVVRSEDCCLDGDLRVEYTCLQCRHDLCSTIGLALIDRSPVVSFYCDQCINFQIAPHWRLDWCVSDDCTNVESTDMC